MRRHTVRSIVFAALLTAVAEPAWAQAVEVQPGARIRVSSPELSAETATVLERHGDTLRVFTGRGSPFDLRISELTALRVSRGRDRWLGARTGALWGAGIYAGLTIFTYAAAEGCEVCDPSVDGSDLATWIATGTITGAIIGAAVGRERWENVPLASRGSLEVRASARRVGLGVLVMF
ncbi:MAG: hypothetical protein IT361_03050 [Gemmatimonadaceae bacterium]|nr:hypothetical protein [Gemmatimonadaceae bacterium]